MSTKESREACWLARDFYLSCLKSTVSAEDLYDAIRMESENSHCSEQQQIIPAKLQSDKCIRLRSEMFSKCPLSWAEHFEKKFRGDKLKEYQVKKLQEIGAQPL